MKKFTKEHYHLFRDGMALRRAHLKDIFGYDALDYLHPNLITVNKYYGLEGTDKLKEQLPEETPYDFELFKTKAPNIYEMYINNERLTAKNLGKYPKKETVNAFLSGILKYDSRGYYFSQHGRKLLVLWELGVLNEE